MKVLDALIDPAPSFTVAIAYGTWTGLHVPDVLMNKGACFGCSWAMHVQVKAQMGQVYVHVPCSVA